MSYNYTPLAQTALRLIEDKGQAMVLRRMKPVADTVVPGADTPTVTDSKEYPCVGVPLVAKPNTFGRETQVRTKRRQVYMAAQGLAITPEEQMWLRMGTSWWSVLSVDTLQPGAVPLLHVLQVEQ